MPPYVDEYIQYVLACIFSRISMSYQWNDYARRSSFALLRSSSKPLIYIIIIYCCIYLHPSMAILQLIGHVLHGRQHAVEQCCSDWIQLVDLIEVPGGGCIITLSDELAELLRVADGSLLASVVLYASRE